MKKRSAFHVSGIISLLLIGEFWIRYFAFCRFNSLSPFNQFVHRYPFAAEGLLLMMALAVLAGCVAVLSSKLWLLISFLAVGTIFFIFSQIT